MYLLKTALSLPFISKAVIEVLIVLLVSKRFVGCESVNENDVICDLCE